jgi:hypothetical protein
MVASILAFNAKRGYAAFGREHAKSDEEFVRRLGEDVRELATSWAARAESSLLVRYEKLITRPQEMLEQIFSYLDVDSSGEAVQRVMDEVAARLDAARNLYQTSATVGQSVGRWRRDLTPAVTAACETEFAEFLALFGYL